MGNGDVVLQCHKARGDNLAFHDVIGHKKISYKSYLTCSFIMLTWIDSTEPADIRHL